VEPADLKRSLELLVGSACTVPDDRYFEQVAHEINSLDNATFGQVTRALIAAGEDRICEDFYTFFSDLDTSFEARVSAWRRLSMQFFGNFRFAFKRLRRATTLALNESLGFEPIQLEGRPVFGEGLRQVSLQDTPLLGYIAGAPARALYTKREASENLSEAESSFLARFEEARLYGLHNTYEYVCSPWMDVYVATSMRTNEDFYSVSRFLTGVFSIADLSQVSYFDPTQSYHDDRIVKGIVEGLMLKRASCTIYLVQESDTLGKDSELATTLAQGKPVVAYVPGEEDLTTELTVEDLKRAASASGAEVANEHPEYARLVDRFGLLQTHHNFRSAWEELGLQEGIESEDRFSTAVTRFATELIALYDRRAATLLEDHPLGLQINLETGVANGILVTRSIDQCRELIKAILLEGLEFDVQARTPAGELVADLAAPIDWDRYLIETTTRSVHRVVVGDSLISNAFWNWYIEL
jgi:hypothetical protein